jgi:hypothetical protein
MVPKNINTLQLNLQLLSTNDATFINQLLNTPGWLQFIGNNKIDTHEQALQYIHRIQNMPECFYWVVRWRQNDIPVGLITLIKRSTNLRKKLTQNNPYRFSKYEYTTDNRGRVTEMLVPDLSGGSNTVTYTYFN